MSTQKEIIDGLPAHLRPFAAYQDYSRYTPRDQAVWRFLLHQLHDQLQNTAHPVYLEGLAKTGINLDYIPRMEEMNASLKEIGWRAVVVDGFIPPAIFMEFQAHRVLVIAVDMRSMEHMLYTPAPDIVHESAGHAPFIVDIDYAEFLQRFGELGMRAISNQKDMAVYEAVRELSIVKEAPGSTAEDLAAAERKLDAAIKANDTPSEAALLSRLHWWTVEYGLVGDVVDYKIFGAGLLSSLGESIHCLDDQQVKKLPLTLNAVETNYDITSEQPQLFVTRNCRHLSQVLEEFGRQMCCARGGLVSLEQAIAAGTVNTAVTNAGVEISGCFSRVIQDAVGNVIYIKTDGPTQLAYQRRELEGHGTACHSSGFSCPVGRLQAMERCLSAYTVDELKQHSIAIGQPACLDFLSGIRVEGLLKQIIRRDQKNLVFTFEKCTVQTSRGEVLFQPDWGTYDMAVGDAVVSVYGGSADRDAYPLHQPSDSKAQQVEEYDPDTLQLFECYRDIRALREEAAKQNISTAKDKVATLLNKIRQLMQSKSEQMDWLLVFEAVELAQIFQLPGTEWQIFADQLVARAESGDQGCAYLVNCGLQRLGVG